ncbi:carbon-nitrogen hydrolase family protein [Paeniglutamicibacter psychrophenolicus]|uniref:Amidohydrolase n=1 Tax=Paeniglutamicibacter psychrophenolicus TaxID=257454 RepID=A0ABS4WJP6_9MICC|nr:carbon-nitrogen hydrolase family protein [Paeniglutamicibacter psychrophenolicus]MBP2376425.1 putative amidohydrolase [Paeniglutamicibacter psychrophenolicus]
MRLALAQIISGGKPAENLALVRRYSEDAKARGAELVIFPEATMCAFGNPLAEVVEPIDGPWATAVRAMASEIGITIVAGMFTPGNGGRVRNTLLATGPDVEASYDKIHLFDAFGFSESDSVDAGTEPVVFRRGGITFGLATCYDVRFPALFTANAAAGAQVNIVCASWGAGEGKLEQWELLCRARALDSTTFVVACGQGDPASVGIAATSSAPTGVGASAAVSPLGSVLVSLGAEPGLAVVDVDVSILDEVRAKLPVLANARTFEHAKR